MDRLNDPISPHSPPSFVKDTEGIGSGQRPRANRNERTGCVPQREEQEEVFNARKQDGSIRLLAVLMRPTHACAEMT